MRAAGDTRAVTIALRSPADLPAARAAARALATAGAARAMTAARFITIVSELARNAITHGCGGDAVLAMTARDGQPGLQVCVTDQGPGIADPALALTDGHSTRGGLGLGLPGSRRLAHAFELTSPASGGTRVLAWVAL